MSTKVVKAMLLMAATVNLKATQGIQEALRGLPPETPRGDAWEVCCSPASVLTETVEAQGLMDGV